MTQIYPQKDFPLLERYAEIFEITKDTIFAYDHKIYSNNDLPLHLIVHECAHHAQQDFYGLDVWVIRYLEDPKFRLAMEIDAYKQQLKSITKRDFRARIFLESVKALSSDLYGNIISYKEAFNILK